MGNDPQSRRILCENLGVLFMHRNCFQGEGESYFRGRAWGGYDWHGYNGIIRQSVAHSEWVVPLCKYVQPKLISKWHEMCTWAPTFACASWKACRACLDFLAGAHSVIWALEYLQSRKSNRPRVGPSTGEFLYQALCLISFICYFSGSLLLCCP